jgi:hypothetical protein
MFRNLTFSEHYMQCSKSFRFWILELGILNLYFVHLQAIVYLASRPGWDGLTGLVALQPALHVPASPS